MKQAISLRAMAGLGLITLLTGCGVSSANYYPQTVSSWQGANVKSLVKTWGTPDNQATSPNGYSVYVYKTVSYSNVAQRGGPSIGVNTSRKGAPVITTEAPNTNMTWNRGMSLTCITSFIADKNGKILETQTSGQTCYGGLSFAKRLSNPETTVMLIEPKK